MFCIHCLQFTRIYCKRQVTVFCVPISHSEVSFVHCSAVQAWWSLLTQDAIDPWGGNRFRQFLESSPGRLGLPSPFLAKSNQTMLFQLSWTVGSRQREVIGMWLWQNGMRCGWRLWGCRWCWTCWHFLVITMGKERWKPLGDFCDPHTPCFDHCSFDSESFISKRYTWANRATGCHLSAIRLYLLVAECVCSGSFNNDQLGKFPPSHGMFLSREAPFHWNTIQCVRSFHEIPW